MPSNYGFKRDGFAFGSPPLNPSLGVIRDSAMQVIVDKRTGRLTSNDGATLDFVGRDHMQLTDAAGSVKVAYELLGGGMEIAIYNDLERRGTDPERAKVALEKITAMLTAINIEVLIS
jgi:hypothetical protein